MNNVFNSDEAIQKNKQEEWYHKLKNLPTIRDFELEEWEDWANKQLLGNSKNV